MVITESTMKAPVLSVLLVLLASVSHVLSKVRILYLVEEYLNPKNLDNNGRACDRFTFYNGPCDPRFTLRTTAHDQYGYHIGQEQYATKTYKDTSHLYEVLQAEQVYPKFPNFVNIELDVYDNDLFKSHLMGRFVKKLYINKSGVHKLKFGSYFQVSVKITIKCTDDFYGQTCEVHCTPRPGLFNCNKRTGARVCAEEFYGEMCDIHCRSSPGQWKCNSITGARECTKPCIKGTCKLTRKNATCFCDNGWTGEFCIERLKDNTPSKEENSGKVFTDSPVPDKPVTGQVTSTILEREAGNPTYGDTELQSHHYTTDEQQISVTAASPTSLELEVTNSTLIPELDGTTVGAESSKLMEDLQLPRHSLQNVTVETLLLDDSNQETFLDEIFKMVQP